MHNNNCLKIDNYRIIREILIMIEEEKELASVECVSWWFILIAFVERRGSRFNRIRHSFQSSQRGRVSRVINANRSGLTVHFAALSRLRERPQQNVKSISQPGSGASRARAFTEHDRPRSFCIRHV